MKWIAFALVCASCASAPAADNFGRPFEQWVPGDVRLFVIDAQACGHFSGEYAYDEERKAFLDRMIKETCTNLRERKGELSRKYARSAQVQKLIAEVAE